MSEERTLWLLLGTEHGRADVDFAWVELNHDQARRLYDLYESVKERTEQGGVNHVSIQDPVVPIYFGRISDQRGEVAHDYHFADLGPQDIQFMVNEKIPDIVPLQVNEYLEDPRLFEWCEVGDIHWRIGWPREESTVTPSIDEATLLKALFWTARDEGWEWLGKLARTQPDAVGRILERGFSFPGSVRGMPRKPEGTVPMETLAVLLNRGDRQTRLLAQRLLGESSQVAAEETQATGKRRMR